MRQFNLQIDKTSPKTSQFTVPAYEHFSILVQYKNWEDRQQWLDYTLADEAGADIVKYKKELESNCVLYFCSYMSASGALHFKSSTGSPAPRDTIQIVAIPSSTQDNCYVCSADYARTTGAGGGGGGVSEEYVDSKVQEEATAREAADNALRAEIPTKTSELTNDSGFLTEHQSLSDYYTKTEVDGKVQVEADAREAADNALRAEIPTKTSQLDNDSGFLTKAGTIDNALSAGFASNVQWSGVADKPTTLDGYGITDAATTAYVDNKVQEEATARATAYDELKAGIPTKTSELQNDSGFLTQVDTIDNAMVAETANTANSVEWVNVQSRPTTVDGYGITDAATTAYVDSQIGDVLTQEEF